ncbi:MAG TPA: hypothetical protein PKO22_02090 [Treponemataceae bacterium]|nr:hypothetical protein [Treponemataceae bacterium]
MRSFEIIVACVSLMAISAAAYAESVTIALAQNAQAPVVALEMSRTIEDEILNDYFDGGHIVSNTPIAMEGSSFKKKNFSVKEAAFGYSDYVIAVYLEYGPEEIKDTEKKTSYAELRSIVWRVVLVSSSKIVEEKTIDATKLKIRDFDPYKRARMIADQVSAASLAAVLRSEQGGKK